MSSPLMIVVHVNVAGQPPIVETPPDSVDVHEPKAGVAADATPGSMAATPASVIILIVLRTLMLKTPLYLEARFLSDNTFFGSCLYYHRLKAERFLTLRLCSTKN